MTFSTKKMHSIQHGKVQRKSLGPFMESSLCLPRVGLGSLPLRALLSHAVGAVKLIPVFKYFRHLVYLLTYTCWNLSSPSFIHSLRDKWKVGDDIFLNFYSWREAWLSGREIFQRTALLWEPSALCVSSGPASAARTAPVSGQRQISQTLLHVLIYLANWKISRRESVYVGRARLLVGQGLQNTSSSIFHHFHTMYIS